MTNRVDHSDHDHPNTPKARAACRRRQLIAKSATVRRTDWIDEAVADLRHARRVIDSIPAETAAYLATAPRSPEPTTIAGDHCQACGSTDSENLNNGDQGYTACCNERVIMNFGSPCTSADCYHN